MIYLSLKGELNTRSPPSPLPGLPDSDNRNQKKQMPPGESGGIALVVRLIDCVADHRVIGAFIALPVLINPCRKLRCLLAGLHALLFDFKIFVNV